MPSWLMEAGAWVMSITTSAYRYAPIASFLNEDDTEVRKQTRIRDSYTWADLYARVTANTWTANCVVTSRINAGAGNQTITVPAATTGVFEDNVNSDAIVNGDLVNWRIAAAPGAGTVNLSVISSSLTAVGNVTLFISSAGLEIQNFGLTQYTTVLGVTDFIAAEVDAQLLVRQASTLSNLRAYLRTNTLDGASTLRLRVNGGNVNQVLNIGAGVTGEFEDAVNTDNIVSGNRIDYQVVTGGTAGGIGLTHTQMKSAAPNRWLGCGHAFGTVFDDGETNYIVGEGSLGSSSVEANVQTEARVAITLTNLFVRVLANSLNSGSTLRTRRNGGNGNLNVSIGAGATGEFEDIVNSDGYAAADLYNFQLVTGPDNGTIALTIISVEEGPPAPAPGAFLGGNIASRMLAGRLI